MRGFQVEMAALALAGALVLALALAACGGGKTAVIGIGNSSNRFADDELDALAEAIVETGAIPELADDTLRQVFAAIQTQALKGDTGAAKVVFHVAERQREAAE